MKSYIVEGGNILSGEIEVSGSKNASLPILAASILNANTTKLYNIPRIQDTKITLKILKLLGCEVKSKKGKIVIDSKNIYITEIPEELMREMRSSIILAGALIGRFKKVKFSYPGGCDIGSRPIDLHLKAFRKLGIKIEEKSGFITCTCDKIVGNEISLDFPSVGATENIMLASIFCEGVTYIKNSALEPEIVDLQKFLNKMGAKIEGAGTSIIKITGVKNLKEVSYNVMPDRIEAGTLLCAAAVTGGNLKLKNIETEHIEAIIDKLRDMGCELEVEKRQVELKSIRKIKAIDIKTMPYPGFPTDLQSIFSAVLTVAKGTSIITENIFESRYKCMSELKRMGAKVTIDNRIAVIKGVRKLTGSNVKATDLRGGAALLIAALSAKGKTKIDNIEYILRGYESLDKKLNKLGAKVYIKDNK
ncbi:MAG: UDP-N-acetylglucosamine 1-carboxyvinyltransferase [Clostridia bacterium]|nr:UDP-N-acetylglucosamine 1-carboxyvinyltransferase [Clostridia bacterium]